MSEHMSLADGFTDLGKAYKMRSLHQNAVDEFEPLLDDIFGAMTSWFSPTFTYEDMLIQLRQGMLLLHLFEDDTGDLVAAYIHGIDKSKVTEEKSAFIHVARAKNITILSETYWIFEDYLVNYLNVQHVEANVRPTIARWAMERGGFDAPAVVIRKRINREDMN